MDHRTELSTAVELARLGNARQTAEHLGVAQSTVTEAIHRLERVYGTRLFDRDQRGSRPTATGQLIIDAARQSLEILANAEREVGLLEGFERGSLSIAAHPYLVETYLVPAVAEALRQRSHIQCRIQTDSPDGLVESLRARRLELFVGLRPDGPTDDLHLDEIGTYQAIPFCRAGHPLAAIPAQGIKVLRDYPFVTTDAPQWYAERLQAGMPHDPALVGELAERGRQVHVHEVSAMAALVKTTDALGFAPIDSIRSGVDDGTFVALDVPAEQRSLLRPAPIVIATIAGRALPPSANAIIDILRSHRSDSGPDRPVEKHR